MISIESARTALPPLDAEPGDDAPAIGPTPPVIVPRLPTEEEMKKAMQALREMASVQYQIANHLSPPQSDVPNTSPAVLADPLDVHAVDPRTLSEQLGKSVGAGDVGASNDPPVVGSPPMRQLNVPSGESITKALQEQRERRMQSVQHQDQNAADLLFAV